MEPPTPANPARPESHWGALYASTAFLIWAAFPLYFKAVRDIPATQVLAHRIVWSLLFVALLLMLWRKRDSVFRVFRNPALMGWLTLSALLVSANWLIFIWAIANDHVLESSLGYFINPLINVVLGVLILRERLRRLQWFAILLATIGVGNLIWQFGEPPWIALSLATSFGLYGLIRKRTAVNALTGLFVETLLLAPLALVYLVQLDISGSGYFGTLGWANDLLLAVVGVLTATPLILFAAAAKRLRLSTLGQLQYTVPTGHFLLAVFVFGEPFTRTHAVTFLCIWVALAIYAFDTYREERGAVRPM